MSRFGSSSFDSYTKASTLEGKDFAFTDPILDSPVFILDILLIIKKVGNFTLKNLRRILENCGRIPENCDRIPENCDRIPEFCDRILEFCGSFLGNYQGFRVKYEGLFGLNSGKPIIHQFLQMITLKTEIF